MQNQTVFYLLLFFLIATGTSCGSRKPAVKKFYVIDLPEPGDKILADSLPTINKYCEIIPASIYPAYATTQIAIRSESHEIEYFTYHEWAVRPQEILTRLQEEYLRQQRVFREASVRFWKNIPDVKLESTVFNLEVFEENNTFMAHLNMEIRLVNNETGDIILKHRGNSYQELDKKNLNLFAAAISEMFQQELKKFSVMAMTHYSSNTGM